MPGINVNITTAPTASSSPTDSGKLFIVGQTERGSTTEPTALHSYQEYKNVFGSAVAGVFLSVGIEAFFQEGGGTIIVQRGIGAGAATAKAEVESEAAVAKSVLFEAANPGAWGNKVEVTITKESAGKIGVKVFESTVLVEEVLNITTVAQLEESFAKSRYVHISQVAGKTGLPKEVAKQAIAGGVDGSAPAASELETALGLFGRDLGGGQVAAPGYTAQTINEALMKHAESLNRFALLDFPNRLSTETVAAYMATLKTRATALAGKTGSRRSAAFSSWANIPGLVPLTTRLSPWSTTQAGIIARNDATASPPPVNEASAGTSGKPRYISSLVAEYNRAQREELNESRINAIRSVASLGIETYGNVTLVSQVLEPVWQSITAVRLFNFVITSGEVILERFVFDEIDPHRGLFTRVGSALQAFLESLGNQMYNNPKEAVNVGSAVNTNETIAKHELLAAIEIKPSPSAESVTLNVTAQQ